VATQLEGCLYSYLKRCAKPGTGQFVALAHHPGGTMQNSNDLARFTAFAAQARPELHRRAYRLCGDWQQAEDLVQEVLIAIFRRWGLLRDEGDLSGYCYRILVNAVRRERRRAWRRHELIQEPPNIAWAPQNAHENREFVARTLSRLLGPRQQLIVTLRYLEDLSVEQTAQIADCSPGTVRSQSSRAIATLRGYARSARRPPSTSTEARSAPSGWTAPPQRAERDCALNTKNAPG
jgi:RNA polymerase sigma-70 factor (sigma-E family)